MRCASGCKHGKCLTHPQIEPLCKNNLDCGKQEVCVDGLC